VGAPVPSRNSQYGASPLISRVEIKLVCLKGKSLILSLFQTIANGPDPTLQLFKDAGVRLRHNPPLRLSIKLLT